METQPLHRNADAILTERIAEAESGIARRDFLRIAGVAGLGLGFQSALAERVSPDSASAKAGAEIIPPGDFLVGLDMGTCKVCAAVGERQPDGAIKIHGIGQAPSLGIRGGEVVDPEAAGRCVREALVAAEVKCDVMIGSVQLAVYGGPSIHGFGRRATNSIRCVQHLNIEVRDVVFRPIASAQAVLDADQMNRGALVIDIGAGTTCYAVYANGEIKDLRWRSVGGDNITNDLSLGLRMTMVSAEKLKIEDSSAWLGQAIPGERIVLKDETGFSRKVVEGEMLNKIIHCRVRAIFERMKARIETSGVRLDSLGAGVHLTGGCSLLRGTDDLAQQVFGLPVQLARVAGVRWAGSAIENPGYSCAIGLLKLGATDRTSLGTRYFGVLPEAPVP